MQVSTQQTEVRVLLIDCDDAVRDTRARKLLSSGYRVSAIPDPYWAPRILPTRLYDVIVVNADYCRTGRLDWCKHILRRGVRPAVVLIGYTPFPLDPTLVPALVIAEPTPKETEEKLLAFLKSVPLTGKQEYAQ